MPESASSTGEASGLLPRSEGDHRRPSAKEAIMKVEILYFAGCPNHLPAVVRALEVLRQEGAPAEVVEVEVKDAAAARVTRFLGSPTIRIDGSDVEPAARSAQVFGLACRTYINDGYRAGVPPIEWIRAAVREARGRPAVSDSAVRTNRRTNLASFGAVASALSASSCCLP